MTAEGANRTLRPKLWRRRVEPFSRPLVYAWFRAKRGLTLGVRGVVTDGEGRVLLVQHTYVPGWYLPGGGVERRETS
jgi:8-oxo-dGTP pyrophosphatase MutT (NUDIX family)